MSCGGSIHCTWKAGLLLGWFFISILICVSYANHTQEPLQDFSLMYMYIGDITFHV